MDYRIVNEVQIDIRYHRIHPNIVPEYEVREAAIYGHYNWDEFVGLDRVEKALCLAQFRVHHRIDNVVQQEITSYTKSKMRK